MNFKSIKMTIARGDLADSIKDLIDYWEDKDDAFCNELIVVNSAWVRYMQAKRLGIESNERLEMTRRNLELAVLEICNASEKIEENLASNKLPNHEDDISKNLRDKEKYPEFNSLFSNIDDFIIAEVHLVMKNIENKLSEFIPGFKNKFSDDFHNKLIEQLRDENVFKARTARVLIFGKSNVGKTTTINSLLSEQVFPTTDELNCTKSILCGEHKGGLIFYDSPGLEARSLQENITRVVLLLPQLNKNQVEYVRLFDLTQQKDEGPTEYRKLDYEEFKEEIENVEFYSKKSNSISVKEFYVQDFQNWVKDKFDFYIYVMEPSIGLNESQQELLQEICQNLDNQIKIFKVINIKGDKEKNISYYTSDIEIVKNKFPKVKQAIKELGEMNVPNYDDWTVIDAFTGKGIDDLLKKFAQSLPPEVLIQMEKSIRRDHVHLINERLDDYFFDYVSNIATNIAVFPVDHEVKGESLLEFGIKSIIMVSEFIYGTANKVQSSVLDSFIKELKKSKKKKSSYTYKTNEKYYDDDSSGSPFLDFIGDVFNLREPGWKTREVTKRSYDTYYTIGGVESIELTIAIGKALHAFYFNQKTSSTYSDFIKLINSNHQLIDKRYELKEILKRAKKYNDERYIIAEKIQPLVKKNFTVIKR